MSRVEKSFLEKPQRRPEKHKKPLGESATDSRIAKISFKKYLRQVEEELLNDGIDDDDLHDLDDDMPIRKWCPSCECRGYHLDGCPDAPEDESEESDSDDEDH